MTSMDFYLSSNSIRELVLMLNKISGQVFEISLNSSLVTDEISNHTRDLKGYAVYSEKMNVISAALGSGAQEMLRCSTRIMELSLEKTKYQGRIYRLEDGLKLMSEGSNFALVKAAAKDLKIKLIPLETQAADMMGLLENEPKSFALEVKKLWLLSTNLKTQVESDEISYLNTINNKIERTLVELDQTVSNLLIELKKLGRNL